MLEYIILGFLLHGDLSGYDIKQCMTMTTANFYDASFGSIYPMLKKMEGEGKISSKEVVDGGKYKKVYTIAQTGRELFFRWLEQPIELNRSRQDFLVRFFFLGWLPVQRSRAQVGEFIKAVAKELAGLEALEKEIGGQAGGQAHFFEMATLDYGKNYYRFALQWCQEFLQKLDHMDNTEIERECNHENHRSER